MGQPQVGTEMLVVGVLAEGSEPGCRVLQRLGVELTQARSELATLFGRGSATFKKALDIPFTTASTRALADTVECARSLGSPVVDTSHVLLAVLQQETEKGAQLLGKLCQSRSAKQLKAEMLRLQSQERTGQKPKTEGQVEDAELATTLRYGKDLTLMARRGELDPLIGREEQLNRTVRILGRRSKNNPVLIGEAGVGKSAIAYGLAQRIAEGRVPESLRGRRVVQLDLAQLLAGTRYRGDFEERLKGVVQEVANSGRRVILVIDEVHTLVGAGGTGNAEGGAGIDAANLLKPSLARGELQCVGATTLDEYRQHIERDPALERRFQPVMVHEPSEEEAQAILSGIVPVYESHHRVRYTPEALQAAVQLSAQYISERQLPDKAVDVIDEAGAKVRQQHHDSRVEDQQLMADGIVEREPVPAEGFMQEQEALQVNEEDIAEVVAGWTGVPVSRVGRRESERLLGLEADLQKSIIGQSQAVKSVSRALRRARAGLRDPSRPIAGLLFCGPTGVGKTQLCKTLAASFFGKEDAMLRLDMSEFMEKHTVSKLIGAPPGYVGYSEGGSLTEAIRRKPYSLVLFDEVEKAHPDIFNMMLQVLDDGRLTDAHGRTVSFANALIVMTSNVGSRQIERGVVGGGTIGFGGMVEDSGEKADYGRLKELVMEELKSVFRPEFLNRVDEVVVFQPLSRDDVRQIAEVEFPKVLARLSQRGVEASLTDGFKDKVVSEGFFPAYGARPLRRAITRLLEDTLSEHLLELELVDDGADENRKLQPELDGVSLTVDVDEKGEVIIRTV